MRPVVIVLMLLLSACDGVIPAGDGRYTSNATAKSAVDNPIQRAQQQAEAFCQARGQPLVVESTAGSTRPEPATSTVHFRCGYPPQPHDPVVAVPLKPVEPPPSRISLPVVAGRRFGVVVSFASPSSGVDPAAQAAFETQVKALEAALGHAVERHTVHWGREGEYNVCLDLKELDESHRHAFAQQLRDRYRSSDRSGIKEDAECGD